MAWLTGNWKLILWGLVALVALVFLFRNWDAVRAFVGRLWSELLGLFGFWGRGETESADASAEAAAPPLRPFSERENPFFSGRADRLKPGEVLRLTFDALQAWSVENGRPRTPHETPIEFAQHVGTHHPSLGDDAREVGQLYARLAYAGQSPGKESLQVMERLWRRMGDA